MLQSTPQGWRNIVRFYLQRRLLVIFLLGMASGYPWIMIGSSMSAWLNELGFTRATVGYFGAVFAAYSVNFLWSPLIDRIRMPVLSQWLGHRRGWILFCQLMVAVTCFYLAQVDFTQTLRFAGMLALAIAVFSATQDVAIDAFRIDSIGEHEARVQSAGAAMATAGWWTGFGALGAVPFFLSDLDNWDWSDVYQLMALGMLFLTAGIWLAREPQTDRGARQRAAEIHYQEIAARDPRLTSAMTLFAVALAGLISWAFSGHLQEVARTGWLAPYLASEHLIWLGWALIFAGFAVALIRTLMTLERRANSSADQAPSVVRANRPAGLTIKRSHKVIAWLVVTLIEPLAEFFRRSGVRFALSILLFVLLFKVGEAFLGRMSIVFYQEVGFTNSQIGLYSKLVNWWVTIAFALIGSYVTMRLGILKGLFIGGSAMAASNLLFSALALTGPNVGLLLAAVITDGFTSAWSTVAFVALISLLANRAFTATQYALMASLGTLGRTVLAAYSGAVVDWLDGNWALFFLLTTIMVIPSLLLLWTIRHKIQRLEDDNQARQDAWDRENGYS